MYLIRFFSNPSLMLNLEDIPLTQPICSLDPMAVLSTSFSVLALN